MKYHEVYFRINTPSYYNGNPVGFADDGKAFYDEITGIFAHDGWKVHKPMCSGECPTVHKDNQSLYLHPQCPSGVLSDEQREHIETLMQGAKTFRLEATDIYKECYDMSIDEAREMLNTAGIKEWYLKDLHTTRTTKFKTGVIDSAVYHFEIPALHKGKYADITKEVCTEILHGLVESGMVIYEEIRGKDCYRAANKTELRRIKPSTVTR